MAGRPPPKGVKFHQKRFNLLMHSFEFSSIVFEVVKVDIKVTNASLTKLQCLQCVTPALTHEIPSDATDQ